MFADLRTRLGAIFRRSRVEQEMAEEMAQHLAHRVEDLIARGMLRPDAERHARLEFGSVQSAREEAREALGLRLVDLVSRDLRYAVRVLGKTPGFALTVVITLSLCIGANTAIYSVVDAVLFRPLPYPEPDRLAIVVRTFRSSTAASDDTSQNGRTWEAIRDHATMLDAAVYFDDSSGVNLAAGQSVEFVKQQRVSTGFFRVLGAEPLAGREFTRDEDRPGGPAVALLSHHLWMRLFHGDRSAVGQKVTLRGEPYTVVGIMPQGFQTSAPADLWTPLRPSTSGEGQGENYTIMARLRPEASWAQASAQMEAIGRTALKDLRLPAGMSVRLAIFPLQQGMTQDWRRPLYIFWAAVAVVLLIGCLNVASLLLARAAGRAREIGTRMALGCGRAGVIRQLLTESLVLAAAGTLGGLVVGYGSIRILETPAQELLGIWQTLTIDARVLGGSIGLAFVTTLLFGAYPAFHNSRLDIRSALSEAGGRGIAGAPTRWPRRILVTAEVALGVVLLAGAGLLIRTFSYLAEKTPGFDPNHVLTASLSLLDARYDSAAKINRLFDDTLARIRAVPGVESAGVGLTLPYQRPLNTGFRRPGGPADAFQNMNLTYATPGYFETLRIPLLSGRLLNAADTDSSAPVMVVNERFVKAYLAGETPVGTHIRTSGKTWEIVGVIGDVQQRPGWGGGRYGPISPMPGGFVPASQYSDFGVHIWFAPNWVVRSSLPTSELAADMQRAVTAVDPLLPFASFRSIEEIKQRTLAMQRLQSLLMAAMAGLALLLAAVGLYGLISNSVAERTHELGIRMALGSTVGQGMWAVISPGMALSGAGVAIGCLMALGAAQALKHFLWGVAPNDPLTFAAVALGLLAVAALASFLPALRVTRLNPAQVLRNE